MALVSTETWHAILFSDQIQMDIRKALDKFYWTIQGRIVPSLKYSQELYKETLNLNVSNGAEWLDLGCGHAILPTWRSKEEKDLVNRSKRIVGLDYDLGSLKKHQTIALKVCGDITTLPFKNSQFDLVTSNMVVEHLDNPSAQFQEINRILKPGGIFIFHTPNALGYSAIMARFIPGSLRKKLIKILEGRNEEDVFETYYRANTKKRIMDVARTTGFEVQNIRMIVTGAQFAVVAPIAIFELLWIRILMMESLKSFRPNLIAILRKENSRC